MLLAILVFFPFVAGLLVYGTDRMLGKSGNHGAMQQTGTIQIYAAVLAVIFVLAELLMIGFVKADPVTSYMIPKVCGFGLHFKMDGFRLIYTGVAAFMWLMTTMLSGEYFKHHERVARFYLFLLWTEGATMGVLLSADLYTTFIFFELMSFTSYVWVAQEENRPSLRAAGTYLAVAVIGGLVMLMGLFLLYHHLGTLEMDELLTAARACGDQKIIYIAGFCLLTGFGAKAGAFPLHIWLPKAHPVAPAPASALLSGILTKTGIFGILVISCNLFLHDSVWGSVILVLGVITMFGGAVLAVFSVDLKRTLACSSMSQIGFILVGVGMQGLLGEENALAVHGTLLHMVNHSLIKLVLFMAAGVIFMNAHALDLNVIRGYGRKKPLLKVIFLTGALAIGGIPLFGGYVSKTLLHEAIVEYGGGALMTAVEWIFLFSGGLTIAYMTKLFVSVFVEKNQDKELQEKYDGQKKYMNLFSGTALSLSALILFLWGFFPGQIMDRAAELGQGFMKLEEFGHSVSYFHLENLKGACISLAIGAVVYLFFIRKCLMKKQEEGTVRYVNLWPEWLDLENLVYRPLLLTVLPTICAVLCRALDSLLDSTVVLLRRTLYRDSPLPHERPEGNPLTVTVGSIFNGIQKIRNRFRPEDEKRNQNYVHVIAVLNEQFKANNRMIERSLSFGLLLFGIGLTLTLVYLILW